MLEECADGSQVLQAAARGANPFSVKPLQFAGLTKLPQPRSA